ncbi:MAG: hypothetical protein AB8G96_11730 [Phycisphaerales bacterium]
MDAPPESFAPRPFVLLEHVRPDHPVHYDWLLATDPEGSGPLLSWRLATRLDRTRPAGPEPAVLHAARAAAHRAVYLTYEGPVSGNRGTVTRVASGTWCTPAGPTTGPDVGADVGTGLRAKAAAAAAAAPIAAPTIDAHIWPIALAWASGARNLAVITFGAGADVDHDAAFKGTRHPHEPIDRIELRPA